MPRTSRALSALLTVPLALASLALVGPSATGAPASRSVADTAPDVDLVLSHYVTGMVERVGADGTSTTLLDSGSESSYSQVATDREGRLYVVAGQDVVRINRDGSGRTVVATLPSDTPVYEGLAVDRSGNVFATGHGDNSYDWTVYRVAAGEHVASVVAAHAWFTHIGTDAQGNLLVISYRDHDYSDVVRFSPSGERTTVTNRVVDPTDIVVRPGGDFYLSMTFYDPELERTQWVVRHYSAAGELLSTTPSPDGQAMYAIGVDQQTNIYAMTSGSSAGTLFEIPADGGPARALRSYDDADVTGIATLDPVDTAPPVTPVAPSAPTTAPAALHIAEHPHHRGHQMWVRGTGFAPGESYEIRVSGVVVGHGVADAHGAVEIKVRVPFRAHKPRAMVFAKGTVHRARQVIRVRGGR